MSEYAEYCTDCGEMITQLFSHKRHCRRCGMPLCPRCANGSDDLCLTCQEAEDIRVVCDDRFFGDY